MRNDRATLRNLVPHPRYGSSIIPSGTTVLPEVIRSSFWQYTRETIFPETAIPADLARQSNATLARPYYVDMLKECRNCHRNFIFFAQEQKYWYEDLRFTLEADCVCCPLCRREDRLLRDTFTRYSAAASRRDLPDSELAEQVDNLCTLLDAGIVTRKERATALVSAARKRLTDPRQLTRLETALAASPKRPK